MKLDTAYEIVDSRHDIEEKLAPIGYLQSLPAGMQITTIDGRGFFWEVPDDDESLEDREDLGMIVMHTRDGPVTLVELTLDNFQKLATSLPVADLPDFKSDAEVNTYYLNLIKLGGV